VAADAAASGADDGSEVTIVTGLDFESIEEEHPEGASGAPPTAEAGGA
jgi:hypothetical protein